MSRPLILIVVAELFGTSLWFTGNSAAVDLAREWRLQPEDQARLIMAVQGGFIVGTLLFALSGLADAFPASRFFAVAAVFGAVANAGFAFGTRMTLCSFASRPGSPWPAFTRWA